MRWQQIRANSSTNASVSVTVTPAVNEYVLVKSVFTSYDVTLPGTAGVLLVKDDTTNIVDLSIPSNGITQLNNLFIEGSVGNPVVVSLSAGGTGVTGKVNCTYKIMKAAQSSNVGNF